MQVEYLDHEYPELMSDENANHDGRGNLRGENLNTRRWNTVLPSVKRFGTRRRSLPLVCSTKETERELFAGTNIFVMNNSRF